MDETRLSGAVSRRQEQRVKIRLAANEKDHLLAHGSSVPHLATRLAA